MKKIALKSVIWKEGKYYVSQCLDVDVASFGNTKKEALDNLQDALELYLEDERLPKSSRIEQPAIASVTLKYA
ncbi:MAG: hypothetical protein A2729_04735 [Candidatus Buchananbacteria bacterium RIFCSPHIGHO2_01_FULL_39_14]|uniref:HicB-like antitoxin of toxin-antitoxin system domain-containing protein n=1 Tax=Candidatus Buchananbacteria bacterium RIFCSPHIGHO2_01_FULL_39_14 TaxID=1797532 RepID=A0A1G1XVX1_9BACT|nr:MAG: hypothetical protein A2729_04735 [Candidatus Buchananbacteria bacterium RIFCSPHIGHO2_01_FULL_39_14]OGY49231.1 MAG: hypothetical protein A3D39_02970 [Candidatus Buchananbacteria bacterium RIFCSPHIGHO2_02_FULL_39_17]